jgi:hypothetical protein
MRNAKFGSKLSPLCVQLFLQSELFLSVIETACSVIALGCYSLFCAMKIGKEGFEVFRCTLTDREGSFDVVGAIVEVGAFKLVPEKF